MPLEIQVIRKGKPVQLLWDDVTLSCVLSAALQESDPELEYQPGKRFGDLKADEWVDFRMSPIYYLDTKSPLWKKGTLTLNQAHSFFVLNPEPTRKPIVLQSGDRIEMWRSHK